MAVLTHYLTPAWWRTRDSRRDAAILRYLRLHPGSEPTTVALALHRNVTTVHRRLRRLEQQGRVTSRWESDDAFFYHAYYATKEHP